MPIIIEIPSGRSQSVVRVANSRRLGHIRELPITEIAIQPIARSCLDGRSLQRSTVDEIDVDQPIAVEVESCHAGCDGLDDITLAATAIRVNELHATFRRY